MSAGKLAMESSAVFGGNKRYRYALRRDWTVGSEPVREMVFMMLNPSTADAFVDDPTIRRCVGFARREGRNRLTVVNAFGFRATNPKELWKARADGIDVIGPDNGRYIRKVVEEQMRGTEQDIVVAWGANGGSHAVQSVLWLRASGLRLLCLGKTKNGHPRHPLYVRADEPLVEF